MRIDLSRDELEAVRDALMGCPLKCHKKLRERMVLWMGHLLKPSTAPDANGWAPMKKRVPIRSQWPSGVVKPAKKKDWAFQGEKKATTRVSKPKPVLTADDILAEL